MSTKTTQGRFPSVRNHLQRRQSKQGTHFSSTSTKQQIFTTESDKKLFGEQSSSTMQSEVAKKIQSKIRMRKPSGSEKRLKESMNGKQSDGRAQTESNFMSDMKDRIEQLWENSQAIYDTLTDCGLNLSTAALKQQMVKESSLIMCQISKGESLENVVVEKLKKKLSKIKCINKCLQKEKFVNSMFDDRLHKLSLVLRTR